MEETMRSSGAVYVQTNEPENAVIAYRREDDGALTRLGSFATGGAGDAKPHLTSQGSVVLSSDGRHLLVSNVASDDVSVFAIREDGLELVGRTPTGRTTVAVLAINLPLRVTHRAQLIAEGTFPLS